MNFQIKIMITYLLIRSCMLFNIPQVLWSILPFQEKDVIPVLGFVVFWMCHLFIIFFFLFGVVFSVYIRTGGLEFTLTPIINPVRVIILVPIDPEVNNMTIDLSLSRSLIFNELSVGLFEISDTDVEIQSYSFQ